LRKIVLVVLGAVLAEPVLVVDAATDANLKQNKKNLNKKKLK
jgi:hypothetical protein